MSRYILKNVKGALAALPLFLLCACAQEELPSVTESIPTDGKVSVRVHLGGIFPVKSTEGGSSIERLDVYAFSTGKDYTGKGATAPEGDPVEHLSFTGESLSESGGTIKVSALSGERLSYLFIANLSDDSGEFLSSFTLSKIGGAFPLSAGNFRGIGADPMCGSTVIEFFKDSDIEVEMHHLGYRLEIGQIGISEGSSFLSGKSVFITRIALINASNTLSLIKGGWSSFGSEEAIYGEKQALMEGTLGGFSEGYLTGAGTAYPTRAYTVTGANRPSSLSGRFIHVHNLSNGRKISLTANGGLLEATRVEIGQEIPESGVLSLDCSLYGIPGRTSSTVGVYDLSSATQNISTKLVVEAIVDGTTLFYPIAIIDPQPGKVYRIGKVILDGEGSPYVNFYPKISTSSASTNGISPLSESLPPVRLEDTSASLWETSR